eukprot:c6449_g1_i1.p1 GENE.c6449_g1_i1~~c6449_g1_i1.p1  ORF type:complete len:283 (-),score=65.54 c6449_g1_i1:255-1043(-)
MGRAKNIKRSMKAAAAGKENSKQPSPKSLLSKPETEVKAELAKIQKQQPKGGKKTQRSKQHESTGDDVEIKIYDEETYGKYTTTSAVSASRSAVEHADRGVIYLGHIPPTLNERQLQSYLSQFGDVTRIRVARSPKTGHSRHYAFIEFENKEVAKIVAETMNNYILFEHILVCHVVESSKVHPKMFKRSVAPYTAIKRRENSVKKHLKPIKTTAQHKKKVAKLIGRERKRNAKLESLGIKIDGLPSLANQISEKPKKTVFSE